MFNFDSEHEILEHDVIIDDMMQEYHDKYLIIINGHSENSRIKGDIVAILTPQEYYDLPRPIPQKYSVGEGLSLIDGLGVYDLYLPN
ncbi:MAG: hypothetical protein FWG68_12895 [Defluviitaleaceae bacterium]|nr:hypothetical protein [Defluviitaleaceae bacterium]